MLERLLGGSTAFRANFIKIASTSAICQVLSVAALPVLSRLYTAEAFGLLTTYMTVHAIALSVATWRVDWILPTMRDADGACAAFLMGVSVSMGMAVLLALSLATGEAVTSALRIPPGSALPSLLPLGVLLGALQLLLQAWYVFGGSLGVVGLSKLLQTALTLAVSLFAGFLALGDDGLLWGYVLGFGAAVLTLLFGNKPRCHGIGARLLDGFALLREHAGQLAASSGLGLINVLMAMMMPLLIIRFYGQEVIGWYGLVFRAATAPMNLITVAVVQSFWAEAAKLVKTDPFSLRMFYLGAVKRLAILALFIAIAALLGPYYVPIIFGREEWGGAGPLLAAVTPYLVGLAIFSPTTHLIVYNKAHWQLYCDLGTLLLAGAAFSAAALTGRAAWLAILSSSSILLAGYIARFFLHMVASNRALNQHRRRTAADMA